MKTFSPSANFSLLPLTAAGFNNVPPALYLLPEAVLRAHLCRGEIEPLGFGYCLPGRNAEPLSRLYSLGGITPPNSAICRLTAAWVWNAYEMCPQTIEVNALPHTRQLLAVTDTETLKINTNHKQDLSQEKQAHKAKKSTGRCLQSEPSTQTHTLAPLLRTDDTQILATLPLPKYKYLRDTQHTGLPYVQVRYARYTLKDLVSFKHFYLTNPNRTLFDLLYGTPETSEFLALRTTCIALQKIIGLSTSALCAHIKAARHPLKSIALKNLQLLSASAVL